MSSIEDSHHFIYWWHMAEFQWIRLNQADDLDVITFLPVRTPLLYNTVSSN